VALEVNSAIGNGVLMPTGITGITCDINSLFDTSVPAEVGSDVPGFDGAYDFDLGGFDSSGLGDFGTGNAGDGLSGQGAGGGGGAGSGAPSLTSSGDINDPASGDTLTAPTICEGGQVIYYRNDPTAPGGRVQISTGEESTYTMTINDVDYSVYAETVCPDPSSPTGFGEPISTTPTPIIRDPNNSPWFYIGVPTTVALGGTYTQVSTNRVFCSSGNPTGDLSNSGGLVPQSLGNVIQWRLLFTTATCTQTCGSGGVATDTGCRIEGKLVNGSTVYSLYLQASSCNPKTAGISNTETLTRTVTSITYDGFAMNVDDFFPPP